MKFTVRHVFNTDVETYWGKLFFDEEYNRRLYKEGLGFDVFKLLELEEEPNGNKMRRLLTEPKSDAPAVVKKLIGDSLAYTETGNFDAAKKMWTYNIVTSKLADRVRIGGRLWAEPKGEKKMERIAEIEIVVKILVGSGTIEKFIEKTTRESYERAVKFTNDFIAEKGY